MLFGSRNVTQMVMVMVYARLLAVTNLNRLVSIFSVISDYGWTKINMISRYQLPIALQICEPNDTLVSLALITSHLRIRMGKKKARLQKPSDKYHTDHSLSQVANH
jgi:hypothetical protein